jgi:tRNA-splicing ligase RtcB
MIHSGSRNLGQRVASLYHAEAKRVNEQYRVSLPDPDLAFLPSDSQAGQDYLRDMTFALAYALENRRRMMAVCKEALLDQAGPVAFAREVNIHHNYAALESHFGRNVFVHRKGATRARQGEIGIIPGSMGTPSYIVRGLGNAESFMSCSHGAGRAMGRSESLPPAHRGRVQPRHGGHRLRPLGPRQVKVEQEARRLGRPLGGASGVQGHRERDRGRARPRRDGRQAPPARGGEGGDGSENPLSALTALRYFS